MQGNCSHTGGSYSHSLITIKIILNEKVKILFRSIYIDIHNELNLIEQVFHLDDIINNIQLLIEKKNFT